MPSYGREQDVPIRPLTKGMFTDLPPNGIPSGGFYDLKNFRVKEGYLETRGGLYPYFNGSADLASNDLVSYDYDNLREKIQDIVYKWKTNGQSETLIISDDFLYVVEDKDTLTKILFTSGSITVNNDTQTDATLEFEIASGTTTNIAVGDYLRIYSSGEIIGRLINIDAGVYTCELDPSHTWSTVAVEFVHTFSVDSGFKVDYTILGGYSTDEAGNVMILTDQAGRGVYSYDGTNLSVYDIDSSTDGDGGTDTLGSAKACAYFDDRLWLGNITEATGTNFPQRIWWSDALDYDRFDPANYIDLPYSQGELLAMKPLGPLLVVYFSDTIYLGQPTQIIGRPYEFQELNTNEIGLVSQSALGTYDDGHFFVGQDDIYYLSGSSALQRIGAPIKSQTVEKTSALNLLDYVQVSPDPSTESVAFLFPDVSVDESYALGLSTKLWRFYYKPQAWAYDSVPVVNEQPQAYFSCISHARTVTKGDTYEDWQDLDGQSGDPAYRTLSGSSAFAVEWDGDKSLNAVFNLTQTDASPTGTPPSGQLAWADLESYADLNSFSVSAPRLFMGVYYLDPTNSYFIQNIMYESKDAWRDYIGSVYYNIDYQMISADYDFGHPDRDKFTRQFSLRTLEHADLFFQPTVWVSDGKARINTITGAQEIWWQQAPTVKYFTNYNEGKTGFLIRGSIFKFKVHFTRSPQTYSQLKTYYTDQKVLSNDTVWRSLVDDNLGNTPTEGANWTEVDYVGERYRISEIVIRTKIEGIQVDQ
jgi:hypothetical protein